jgi:hypothetical protein
VPAWKGDRLGQQTIYCNRPNKPARIRHADVVLVMNDACSIVLDARFDTWHSKQPWDNEITIYSGTHPDIAAKDYDYDDEFVVIDPIFTPVFSGARLNKYYNMMTVRFCKT